MTLLYVVAYACVVVCLAAILIRGYRAKSMPVHLRWELYPVAHEKGKARHGGSYFEELDWWTKARSKSRVSEMTAMGAEILLLKGVWEHNRSLWWRSYPFHLGLYLLMGFLGLTVLSAILQAVGICPTDGTCPVDRGLGVLILLFGVIGLDLTALGSLLMLVWRLTDQKVRDFTKPAHIFNLVVILVVVVVARIAVGLEDQSFAGIRGFTYRLITFDLAPVAGGLMTVAILLGCLLIAYIPLTHMAHFFLKYFTWHQIRWNDEPNVRGGKLEAQILDRLGQPVTWSAPHWGADGKKTWADLATSDMPEQKKEEK